MTEYDFSPGAVRAHIEKLQKIERWTAQIDPYTVRDANTPATPAPDGFLSLSRDENSRTYRPKHIREKSYERDSRDRGYGYDRKRDVGRYRDRDRDESSGRRERERDRDRSFEDDDAEDGYHKPRAYRSKSHNVSPSPAKHPPPATRSYTMPLKPTNTRRPSSATNQVYPYGSGSAAQSQHQVYKGSSYDLNSQNHSSSKQGSKYNLPATAPAGQTRHHKPRSASTTDVTSGAGVNGKYSSTAVYDQNKYYPSRGSFDHPHAAPAPGYANGNGQSQPPASATLPRAKAPRTHSSTTHSYPYGNGIYASQQQAQAVPQKSQIYLPSKSQGHLPQPQAQPAIIPAPATAAANGRKAPPAPLNLPPYPSAPQANGYPHHQYTSSKLAPYYPAAGGPHTAPAPGYPAVPGASGYPSAPAAAGNGSAPNSASIPSSGAAAGSYPLPPGFQPQTGPMPISPNRVAFKPPTPTPPLPQYTGPMPTLKEKPKPLIKRLFGTLTGSKATSTASLASSALGSTPANSPTPEFLAPPSAGPRGVSLDSGTRPVSAPPIRSRRSKDREREEREKDRRAREDRENYDRERARTTPLRDIEKVGETWYDMYDSSMEQDKEWEVITKDSDRSREEKASRGHGHHVRTATLKKRHAGESRRERERGTHGGGRDRRLSH